MGEEEDHPRECGEKGGNAKICQQSAGSPPQMRGKVVPYIMGFPPFRITPANAGKRLTYKHSITQSKACQYGARPSPVKAGAARRARRARRSLPRG